jgi:hypothetical protein
MTCEPYIHVIYLLAESFKCICSEPDRNLVKFVGNFGKDWTHIVHRVRVCQKLPHENGQIKYTDKARLSLITYLDELDFLLLFPERHIRETPPIALPSVDQVSADPRAN